MGQRLLPRFLWPGVAISAVTLYGQRRAELPAPAVPYGRPVDRVVHGDGDRNTAFAFPKVARVDCWYAVMAVLVTAIHADGRRVVRHFGWRSGKPWILKGLQGQAPPLRAMLRMAAWMAVTSTAMTQAVHGCF